MIRRESGVTSILRQQNLGGGGIHFRRALKSKGSPWSLLHGAKAHIGEVQASVWDPETLEACREAGVVLL